MRSTRGLSAAGWRPGATIRIRAISPCAWGRTEVNLQPIGFSGGQAGVSIADFIHNAGCGLKALVGRSFGLIACPARSCVYAGEMAEAEQTVIGPLPHQSSLAIKPSRLDSGRRLNETVLLNARFRRHPVRGDDLHRRRNLSIAIVGLSHQDPRRIAFCQYHFLMMFLSALGSVTQVSHIICYVLQTHSAGRS